jgi:PPM family protein phosphatase
MAAPDMSAEKSAALSRPLIMRYAARSDVGRVRAKNDDSAYVGRHLAVVADGMGGHAGGDVASAATVLDMIHLDHGDYDGDAATVLADEIQTANSLLSELVHMDPKLAGMGTTVTALLLAEGKLHFAHIGDSRAYRLRGNEFEQVSIDHTFVQRLIDEGRLLPEEAETHPHKNVLMRVLGDVDASPELDLEALDVEPGDRWLLCSDGLNYVAGHVVERTVRETPDLRECVDTLVNLTLEAGAPDNVTVVMVEIAEETSEDVATDAVGVVPAALPAAALPAVSRPAASMQPPAVTKTAAAPAGASAQGGGSTRATSGTGATAQGAAASDGRGSGATPAAGDGSDSDDATDSGEAAETGAASTDPHLGEHLSAEVLREELASRPHELVGAALTAAETGSIPSIAGRTVARRAALLLTHKADQNRDDLAETRLAPRRQPWFGIAAAAIAALVLGVGLWLGYAWTQTRYYIGEYDQRVAIYNGISQRLGPLQLSTLEAVTEIEMSSLPEFSQQRVRQTVPASDLYDAQRIVKNLEQTGTTSPSEDCVTPSPNATATPGSTPAPGATTAPSPSPTSAPSTAPVAAGAQSPTPTATCEGNR